MAAVGAFRERAALGRFAGGAALGARCWERCAGGRYAGGGSRAPPRHPDRPGASATGSGGISQVAYSVTSGRRSRHARTSIVASRRRTGRGVPRLTSLAGLSTQLGRSLRFAHPLRGIASVGMTGAGRMRGVRRCAGGAAHARPSEPKASAPRPAPRAAPRKRSDRPQGANACPQVAKRPPNYFRIARPRWRIRSSSFPFCSLRASAARFTATSGLTPDSAIGSPFGPA